MTRLLACPKHHRVMSQRIERRGLRCKRAYKAFNALLTPKRKYVCAVVCICACRVRARRQAPGIDTLVVHATTLKPQDGGSSLWRNRAKDQQAEHHYDDDVMIIINRDKPMNNIKIIIPKTT